MKRWWLGAVLALASGCLQVTDQLTLAPDGSGSVHLEVVSGVPAELLEGMGARGAMGGGSMMYPPTSEEEMKRFFGNDATAQIAETATPEGGRKLVADVKFKDVNALLSSPYGKAHALTLKIENGSLVVQALTGFEMAVRTAELKTDEQMGMPPLPGLAEAQKKKGEMRVAFSVTLPNDVSATTGTKTGRTTQWTLERVKAKDTEEFARQVGAPLQASCPATGVTMQPATPVRLALAPFKDLASGAVGPQVAKPDVAKILAAAKFEPYALIITRSVDLSGEGGSGETGAKLIGAVALPHELAPQKWGGVKLQEVVDAKGASLLGKDEDQERFSRSSQMGMERDEVVDEEDAEGETKPPVVKDPLRRQVMLIQFQAPDWKVKEIARIKGTASLQYLGGAEVVKVANAIPAEWIMDMKKAMYGGMDRGERKLNSPELVKAGVPISGLQCMSQNGMTMLMLQSAEAKATVTDVQVFDAEGHPWPTAFQNQDMGGGSMVQIMVTGKPTAPLSLALVVSGVGATVEVPIQLEHVAVGAK
jgi:hypothetical protein